MSVHPRSTHVVAVEPLESRREAAAEPKRNRHGVTVELLRSHRGTNDICRLVNVPYSLNTMCLSTDNGLAFYITYRLQYGILHYMIQFWTIIRHVMYLHFLVE